MKKYLLILSSLELGGAERQAVNFAEYLKKSGNEVIIFSSAKSGKVNLICERLGIRCISDIKRNNWIKYPIKVGKLLRVVDKDFFAENELIAIKVAHFVKKNDIDVIIAYCSAANVLAGRTANYINNTKVVWYQRDAGIFDHINNYTRSAINKCDIVLANSNSGKEFIKKYYDVDAKVIHNGVRLKKEINNREQWRRKLGITDNDILCTMVANLSSAKDHMSILKIWKKLSAKETNNRYYLALAGRYDDQYDNLFNYVQKEKLQKKVFFLNQVDDVSGLLSATDISVFGAISEGSPNGIIESTLYNLPVVATDLPEIREVVSEQNYRFLFSRENIEYACDRIVELGEDNELRHAVGVKNRCKSEEVFSEEINYRKIEKMIENINN